MTRMPFAQFTLDFARTLPVGTTIEFHTSSRTRNFSQAWQIAGGVDRDFGVWLNPRHCLGYFDWDQPYAPLTLEYMAVPHDFPGEPTLQPITEVRITHAE